MSTPPWDQAMANAATVADQCIKLGGVVLKPPKPPVGVQPPK